MRFLEILTYGAGEDFFRKDKREGDGRGYLEPASLFLALPMGLFCFFSDEDILITSVLVDVHYTKVIM